MLLSTLPHAVREVYAPPSVDRAANPGLTMFVLSMIQLEGGKVEEGGKARGVECMSV